MSGLTNFTLVCGASLMSLAMAVPAQSQAVPTTVGTRATAGIYNFDLSVGSFTADGSITADSNGHATAIAGLVDGTDPITGLSNYAGADNDLYATGAWVTFGGLSFSTWSLGDFNFYNSGLGYYGLLNSVTNSGGWADGAVATANVAPVPEPATWAMMLLGFCGIGMVIRRRSKPLLAQLA